MMPLLLLCTASGASKLLYAWLTISASCTVHGTRPLVTQFQATKAHPNKPYRFAPWLFSMFLPYLQIIILLWTSSSLPQTRFRQHNSWSSRCIAPARKVITVNGARRNSVSIQILGFVKFDGSCSAVFWWKSMRLCMHVSICMKQVSHQAACHSIDSTRRTPGG